jgi:thiol-disulfide isomerase/thioredoxin
MRRSLVLVAIGLMLAGGFTRAADPAPPAGFWKLTLPTGKGEEVVLMLAFTEQDGKWIGDYLTSSEKLVAEPTFKSLKVTGDVVQFSLELKGREFVTFDGVLAKDKKKLAGSLSLLGGELILTELFPTKLKKLDDPFELARETLTQVEGGPMLFDAANEVLARAGAKKLPADDVRAILDRVNKAAAGYGPRWERATTLRLAASLAGQEGLGDVAVAQAKRAERLLTDDDDAATRMAVLEVIVKALTKAGKPDEAKPYATQIAKLEARDYAEYAKTFPFKVEPFAGRKGKSDRTVLVELFTGAECPPCVAADLAVDGLAKAYKPADVLVLQYHMHVPNPDPLTNSETMKRAEDYYGDQIRGTPTIFIGGKLGPAAGGPAAAAEKKFATLKEQVDEALEKAPGVKLGLTLAKGEKGGFSAKAAVTDLDMPGDKMTLRFALAEERVRYTGGNGIRYHHMVVRAMPGGQKGFPLTKKTADQTVTFDPEDVQKELTKYLDDFAKTEGPFPHPERPLALKNLKLIAFVQNDTTREILQAVQADVEAK